MTLGGEQFQPGGSLAGGVTKRRKASVMAQKEEMGLLNTKLQVLQAELVKKQQAAADYEKQFRRIK